MAEIVLNAESRKQSRGHAKQTRASGMIPGVFYARGEQNLHIEVLATDLHPLVFTSQTHVIDLRLKDGASQRCIIRDVQFDPITDKPIHFDLQGLHENEKLTVDVPIVLGGGTAKGVKEGGMLQHVIHKLKITCLPRDIPERIELDIADLAINDSIHVRDLEVSNATIMENPDSPVVVVMPPTVAKEAPAEEVAEEEAIAEPEVVGKGKKPEEGVETTKQEGSS
ncbi:MAG: 50S ribosomal protein L25 [Bacteroidota bacterium]